MELQRSRVVEIAPSSSDRYLQKSHAGTSEICVRLHAFFGRTESTYFMTATPNNSKEPDAPDVSRASRIRACLIGSAIGDAFAARTEFLKYDEIVRRWPPDGPQDLDGDPARVTDDTQMMIAVGDAIVAALGRPLVPAVVEEELRRTFVTWLRDPENNRAPGMTCLRSCAGLERGLPWIDSTDANSKGCGANMRVQPIGLLPVPIWTRSALAQFQAAITHGHPTALAASDLTAWVIADLADGGEPVGLVDRALTHVHEQRDVYHHEWLGDLWRKARASSAEEFSRHGWDECLAVLRRVREGLARSTPPRDPCDVGGQGWIAEEAFATALYCFLKSPEDGVAVVRRAAATNGDSDSIACLAGAFAGAHLGMNAWPDYWVRRIEYRDVIEKLAQHVFCAGSAARDDKRKT